MSETVWYYGKATKVENPENRTICDLAREILNSREIEIESYYDDELDCLNDELHDEYFYHEKTNTLYLITKEERDGDNEIIRADTKDDGTIDYELRYYNGGAGFHECLEKAFDKLTPTKQ